MSVSAGTVPSLDIGHSNWQTTRKRALIMLGVLGLWILLIVARLLVLMVFQRERYVAAMDRECWREQTIPAMRGRILDRKGLPLAWSTRHFALQWKVPVGKAEIDRCLALVSRVVTLSDLPNRAKLAAAAGRTRINARMMNCEFFDVGSVHDEFNSDGHFITGTIFPFLHFGH